MGTRGRILIKNVTEIADHLVLITEVLQKKMNHGHQSKICM